MPQLHRYREAVERSERGYVQIDYLHSPDLNRDRWKDVFGSFIWFVLGFWISHPKAVCQGFFNHVCSFPVVFLLNPLSEDERQWIIHQRIHHHHSRSDRTREPWSANRVLWNPHPCHTTGRSTSDLPAERSGVGTPIPTFGCPKHNFLVIRNGIIS